jgi:guanidinopropionase
MDRSEKSDGPSEDITREDIEFLHWWGIPTLFRCPADEDPRNCDIALVGVPHSTGNGTTWRDQHLGPRAVREHSPGYRRVHLKWEFDPWKSCRINDLGDVPILNSLVNDVAVREIEGFYRTIDEAGARPVSIGGDHSISLAILRAIAGPKAKLSGGRPAAVVHFDAHYDTYDDFPNWFGARDSAGHWASKSVHEGHVDATRSVQIGIRGHDWWQDPGKTSRELGYRIVTKDEFDDELGLDGTIALIRDRGGDLPVYVSFDLDVLDTTIAPAVSNPEPGEEGLMMKEAIRLIQGMRGMNVIGADVTELMPSVDGPNQMTAQNATRIMFELISLIADGLRPQGDAA